MIMQNCMLTI
uniref:BLTX734 n=1 Tax=Nephila pilipes TaxID=299642 RepID=A0A076KUQ3_NEPPI|nr:BLTX734 [Nephila pilipes]